MSASGTPTLPRYGAVMRRYWWVILAAVLVCAGGALAWHFVDGERYTAAARLTVNPYSPDDEAVRQVAGLRFQSLNDPFDDAALMANSREVLVPAARRVGASTDPQVLARHVLVTPFADTSYLEVTATQDTPEAARDLANAVAEEFLESWAAWQAPVIEEVRTRFEEALADLGDADTPTARATRTLFTLQIAELNMLATRPNSVISMREQALLPLRANGVGPLLTGLAGGVAGFLLGLVLAFMLAGRNRRLRRAEEVSAETGLPIIATVTPGGDIPAATAPDATAPSGAPWSWWGRRPTTPRPVRRSGSVLVLSDGTPRTTYALARVLAGQGQRVLAIAATPGQPARVARVARGEQDVATAALATTDPQIFALPAEPAPESGAVPLGLSRAQAQVLCTQARDFADWTLCDLTSSGGTGIELARAAEEVALVVRLGRVRRRQLTARIDALARQGVCVSGLVIVGDAVRRTTEE